MFASLVQKSDSHFFEKYSQFFNSIKSKLLLAMIIIAIVLSVGMEYFFAKYDARSYSQFLDSKMLVMAEVIGDNLTSALAFKNKEDAKEVLESLAAVPSVVSAVVFDANNEILAQYQRPGAEQIPSPLAPSVSGSFFSKNLYTVERIIMLDNEAVGSLSISTDLEELAVRKRERRVTGIIIGSIGLLVSIFLAYIFQDFFTRPIREFINVTGKISQQNDYSLRVKKRSTDEFGTLADAFNTMLFEIQKRDKELERHITMLKRTNSELDQFVYAASHDLRAPLRAVDNLTMLIGKATREILPPENREYLDLMRGRVKRMENLIEDLLQYSRIGRIEIAIEEVNTYTLVQNVIELLAPPSTITIDVDKKLPVVFSPRAPLEQIFRNLIGNAIKHHDKMKGRIEVTFKERGENVEFSISDDGPGIDEKYHERIFQMFQTLKTRDEVEGSGMGLALVKKIVDTHGGKIEVISSLGKGASFTFTWPKDLRGRKI